MGGDAADRGLSGGPVSEIESDLKGRRDGAGGRGVGALGEEWSFERAGKLLEVGGRGGFPAGRRGGKEGDEIGNGRAAAR